MKFCSYCSRALPVSEFYRRRASIDGLNYKCKSCSRAANKIRYVAAKDSVKAKATEWALKNRERRLEISRQSDARRRVARTQSAREWRLANPERARLTGRLHAHRRRCSGSLSARHWKMLVQLACGRCVYCGLKRPLTLDHLTPIAAGGLTTFENSIPACLSCNSSKNKRDGATWAIEKFGLQGSGRVICYMIAKKAIERHERSKPRAGAAA
jgi:5-methylcytosine-specific restriction endonuclease McrA